MNPSGIPPNVVTTPTYPEASVHNLTGNWWETAPGGALTRGRLVRTLVPYPDMKPYRLLPEGRGGDVKQHQRGGGTGRPSSWRRTMVSRRAEHGEGGSAACRTGRLRTLTDAT